MPIPLRSAELEAAARERLSSAAYAYYVSGAGEEQTVAENAAAWSRWHLRPRVLVDVTDVSLATTVLGTTVSMPVLTAPCGFNRLAHDDGELAVARAAASAGTVQILSTSASCELEDVASASGGPKWYQLYYDAASPSAADVRIKRAEDAGFGAIVVTVDSPRLGMRYQGFADVQAFAAEIVRLGIRPVGPSFPGLDWRELDRLRTLTSLPIVLKGVLHPADALLAAEAGVDGVVVSNHGGRQLDGCVPTALALPGVLEAAAGRMEVYVDGGVRGGIDVLRALALGARAVLIGRPYLWALALDGEAGVVELLERYRAELHLAMSLAGQTDAAAIDRDIVVPNVL